MSFTNRGIADSLERSFRTVADATLRKAVNFQRSSEDRLHRWFRYREGFSPGILSIASSARRVFDPFCGCGTTLLEAQRRGVAAVGVDVNPLAVFVAQVKTESYTATDHRRFLRSAAAAATETGGSPWSPPPMRLLPKLFQPAALRELVRIRAYIGTEESTRVRRLLLLCWLNILERCSNIFKEGNGLKYRNKLRRPGRYETIRDSVWIPAYFGPSIPAFVRKAWLEQCEMVAADLRNPFRFRQKSEVIEKSCLDDDLVEMVGSCDAAVFSPPYANRFDYFEAFKIELWMGGFVSSAEEMCELRQRSLRNNLTVADGHFGEFPALERLLQLMDQHSSSVRMGI